MKIGILIKPFKNLRNWELRIIEKILNDKNLDLALLIFDKRNVDKKSNSFFKKLIRAKKKNSLISSIIFKIQILIEEKIFKAHNTVDKESIIEKLSSIKKIYLSPQKKGFLDIFSKSDHDLISNYELDIILRHEFNIIRGPILKAAKMGIWSFHHGDNSINRGGPPAFWEIILNQSLVGVTLQKLTSELDGGEVIGKAFFNTHWSYVKLQRTVLESSVSLLFKKLDEVRTTKFRTQKSFVYYNPLYKNPNLQVLFVYITRFYKNFLKKILKKIKAEIFGIRYNCWTLFIGKGNFIDFTLHRLKPLKLPKNEFWADPFILTHENKNYVFFENYNYKNKRGKISCGLIDNNKLINIQDVLIKDYHLSFPYVFRENGQVYLMPETRENNRLELYKCKKFPNEWELFATAFEGEQVADAFFYDDTNSQKWLFVNKQVDKNSVIDNELFIYRVDSIELKHIIPHRKNPVIINSAIARNAGSIFSYNNEIYRPSQGNVDGIYGRCLNLNKINKLTIDEYDESTIITIYPNFKKRLVSTHHLDQKDDLFVIDAAFKSI